MTAAEASAAEGERRLTHSARRVNKVMERLGGTNYLEIGVFRGQTFDGVRYARRTAVDPSFQFDTARYDAEPSVALHEMTSDAFFCDATIAKPVYDCIFLDGLHEFTQTFRDFCATQAYAGPHTVWLIDDVWPNDVFSAWPVKDEAVAFRKEAGLKGGAWHGDVFKVVYLIMTFFPTFKYHMTAPPGNQQLFVWKSTRTDFSPFAGTLSEIETLSYFDMRRRPELFRQASEDAIIEEIAADLSASASSAAALPPARGAAHDRTANSASSDPARSSLDGEAIGPLVMAEPRELGTLDDLIAFDGDADAKVRHDDVARGDYLAGVEIVGTPMASADAPGGAARIYELPYWSAIQERTAPLKVMKLQGARLFAGRITQVSGGRHAGGQLLLTREGRLLSESYATVGGRRTLPSEFVEGEEREPPLRLLGRHEFERIDGTAYLIGTVPRHFGHFLLEGLSRLWFHVAHGEALGCDKFIVYEPEIPRYARRVLRMIGLTEDRILPLKRNAEVETLYVPSKSVRTHRWVRPEHRMVLDAIIARIRKDGPDEDVYLSRRNVPKRRLDNEEEVEALFADAGYRIVHPQSMPIRAQFAMAYNARSLAGCVGSQMYLAQFQRPGAANIVMAPNNFFLPDDAMLSQFLGHRLCAVFGGPIDFPKVSEGAEWTCDLDLVRRAIDWRRSVGAAG